MPSGISGIYVQSDQYADVSKDTYDGNARPGQLVADLTDYSVWIANSAGDLNAIAAGASGVSGFSGPNGFSGI